MKRERNSTNTQPGRRTSGWKAWTPDEVRAECDAVEAEWASNPERARAELIAELEEAFGERRIRSGAVHS